MDICARVRLGLVTSAVAGIVSSGSYAVFADCECDIWCHMGYCHPEVGNPNPCRYYSDLVGLCEYVYTGGGFECESVEVGSCDMLEADFCYGYCHSFFGDECTTAQEGSCSAPMELLYEDIPRVVCKGYVQSW